MGEFHQASAAIGAHKISQLLEKTSSNLIFITFN